MGACAAVCLGSAGLVRSAEAFADVEFWPLPLFVPSPSEWTPDFTVYPYNLWQTRVTPEQLVAERDSCQWFNAQYDQLQEQAAGFQDLLADQHDDWTVSGMAGAADIVQANLDQSAAFLDPRVHTLYVVNYPDRSEYSPLYNGDSFYDLWFQLTQISEKIGRRVPSGQINANIATMNVYGTTIRDSHVCEGA